ncbi:MAG: tetratricopeptide repeat protein [Ahrensia sp.]
MNVLKITFATAILAGTLLSVPAFAAGGGDETPVCKAGMVYDKAKSKCVKAEEQSLNDDALLNNATALAYTGRYEEAITVIGMMKDSQTAPALNMLGYSTRNMGDLEAGLAFYRDALAIDPNYTLARSYMGQALIQSGNRRAAMIELDEIERRSGTDNRAYKLLAKALLSKSLQTTITY